VSPVFTVPLPGWDVPDSAVWALAITVALGLGFALASRRLSTTGLSTWQVAVEMLVGWLERTVAEVVEEDPRPYLPLVAGLMLFIGVSNLLAVVPRFRPPTADLSVTVALALIVFLAVPFFGIRRRGLWPYLRGYARPNVLLVPLNLMGEVTRTVALAVRLFGNMMSGQMVGAILIALAGFLLPVPLMALGLLTGLIQAYIFAILAIVYIAAAVQAQEETQARAATAEQGSSDP